MRSQAIIAFGVLIGAAVCSGDGIAATPATQSASTQSAATRPATGPATAASQRAAERAEGLKRSESTQIEVLPITHAAMTHLFLDSGNAESLSADPVGLARISPEQRRAIIDYLAVEGFLDNATSYDMAAPQYKMPTIVLRVHWGKGFYDEDLGWNLKMLHRLDGLRNVLEGDAAKAMDRFLAQLHAQRTKWEAAATQPATSALAKPAGT